MAAVHTAAAGEEEVLHILLAAAGEEEVLHILLAAGVDRHILPAVAAVHTVAAAAVASKHTDLSVEAYFDSGCDVVAP